MSPVDDQTRNSRTQVNQSLAVGVVAGQVGCLTIIIVLAALFGGLWLDGFFGTKPLFTLLFVIVSIPITLVVLFWVVRRMTSRIIPGKNTNAPADQEELRRD